MARNLWEAAEGKGQKPKAIECNITEARCPSVASHRCDRSRRTKQHPGKHIKRRKTKRNKLWKAAQTTTEARGWD